MTTLRHVGIVLEVQGDNGTTKLKSFGAAVEDVASLVEELTNATSDNVTVSAEAIDSDKELIKQAKAKARGFAAAERRTSSLTSQYKLMTERIGKTANQQEILNAVHSLGAHATNAQRQRVTQLVTAYQRQRDEAARVKAIEDARKRQIRELAEETRRQAAATNAANNSMRNTRGIAQNVGWQLQDTTVQLQAGTSAFVVLSQQGSQLAGAFGPTGALIGAVIAIGGAVGGVLFKGLMSSSKAAKVLTKSLADLTKTVEDSEDGVLRLSSAYTKLYKSSQRAAEVSLSLSIVSAREGMEAAVKTIEDAEGALESWKTNLESRSSTALIGDLGVRGILSSLNEFKQGFGGAGGQAIGEALNRLTEDFGATDIQAAKLIVTLNKAKTTQTVQAFDDLDAAMNDIVRSTGFANGEINEFAASTVKGTAAGRQLAEKLQFYYKIMNDVGRAVDDADGAREKTSKRNKKEIQSVGELILAWEEKTLALDRSKRAQSQHDITTQLAKKGWIDEAGLLQDTVDIYHDRVDAIEAEKKAKKNLATLEKTLGTLSGKLASPEDKIAQRYAESQATIEESLALRVATEKEAQDLSRLNAIRYTQDMAKLEYKRTNNEETEADKRNKIKTKELQNWSSVLASTGKIFGELASLASEGTKQAKALFYINKAIAFSEAIVNAHLGASKAVGMGPFGLTMAETVLGFGYANAGVIAGTALGVSTGKISGAYDKGGYIPNGSTGIVSEYSDELVNGVLVNGPARVTGSRETADMMKSSGSSAAINIYTLPGTTADVTQRADGQTDIRMREIANEVFSKNIDPGVSTVINNNNSKANKALRNKYALSRRF